MWVTYTVAAGCCHLTQSSDTHLIQYNSDGKHCKYIASSPAGRRSTATTAHPPPASVAAARAAANDAAGKLGITGIQTVMGNLEDIQFETEAEDLYDSVDGLKDAMESDTVSSMFLQARCRPY